MKKVLVVDNNPVMLNLMTTHLERDGYEVVTAKDGLSVLELLKSYKPDIIFIDLIMPNIDGERLCRIVRRMPSMKAAAVVIVSALAAEQKISFREWGADACIAKGPFNKMWERIRYVLERLDGKQEGIADEIYGLEDIVPREITRELLSVKNHLEVILSSIAEGILEITEGTKIVYVNPEALSILGVPEENLLASDFEDLFLKDDLPRLRKMLRKTSRGLKQNGEEFLLANGKEVLLTLMPIREETDKCIIIMCDISTRKQLESELRQAQKLEAIGTLAGGIAHDFNNLLMGIQGRTSLMLMSADSSHPFTEHLKAVEDIVRSASDLTRQLLGFARGGKFEVKPADMNEIARKSSEMFGRTKKEIVVHKKFQQKVWTVEIDRGQIEQALLNLYINAWQAMPGGGDIYLETENSVLDESFVKTFHARPGRYVRIAITDNGVGMDEKTRLRIFEPFFTTKEMGRGTGLGLASTYGIIKSHGGIIAVESEKGHGSTFSIYLPASEKEIARERRSAEELFQGHETILVVDDEEVITDVSREILETLGYHVMIARNGKEALEIYRQDPAKIDLVIMDMIMPHLSGGETFDLLRTVNPAIKVILSSGYSMKGQAAKIMERGCRAFLQKPFTIRELSKKVRSVLDVS
ncbi:MAG: response regulator [Syntrophales bacterium]